MANWLSILALGLIWGGTFMVVAIALEGYGPLTVAAARVTLGALGLLALMIAMRSPMPVFTRELVTYLLIIGVLNTALPFAMLSWGQQYVPSAFAGISMSAIPVLRIGTGWEPLGQLACVAAALFYAISSVMTRRCPPMDSITMAALLMVIGAVPLIPAMLIVEGVPQMADSRSMLALLFLGIFPTALATLIRVFTIRTAGAIFMTLVNYQVPVWSMIFGTWILSETLPLRFFAALGLIMIGLLISQWQGLRKILGRIA